MPRLTKHLLCVEDDLDNREVLAALLRLRGYEVTTARTMAEATNLAKQQHFDLYLLDRKLPDGDGLDLCTEIRAADAEIPIIICSAYAYEDDIKRGLEAGAQAYFTKPVELIDLETAIKNLTR
jgi:DNA-binding response OmpR family regulator